MNITNSRPDYVFSVSWEVCNKVGGIYTVLSTQAKSLKEVVCANLIFIGPDLLHDNPLFTEDASLYEDWKDKIFKEYGIPVRVGKWRIPGKPVVILIDFRLFFKHLNGIYGRAWELFGVNSLHAYGDYGEASAFSYAAGVVVAHFCNHYLQNTEKIIYHAHEWMTGLGALFAKRGIPKISTVFTTHATTVGRSIAGNGKPLYDYFRGYFGDQMAFELGVEAKHSVEKQTALQSDCFTTVSQLTAKECEQLIGRKPHVITLNGFERSFVPQGDDWNAKRTKARTQIARVVNSLMGTSYMTGDFTVIGIGGRPEFRNKGIDMFIDTMDSLRAQADRLKKDIVALVNIPSWVASPRADLQDRLKGRKAHFDTPLPNPYYTHELHNMDTDTVMCSMRAHGFANAPGDRVKVLFVPCYLDAADGIFNQRYYDLLTGQDLAVYPSYYEPWGYTPLESCAFGIPTITTDLAGFGLWVMEQTENPSLESCGVQVVRRTDSNYAEAVHSITETVLSYMELSARKVAVIRNSARWYAERASWDNFIEYYARAYAVAMKNNRFLNN